MESFKADHRKAFYGKCLVVVQNNGRDGNIQLTASSGGLEKAETTIKAE